KNGTTGINRRVNKDGAFYLFTLRLIPVVPFFAINLLMGLTRMPLWVFYGVSQLGMLAGTLVYVNAGTALGDVQTLSGVFSPALLGSFALLAAFPWLARAVLARWNRARRYRGFNKPARFDRNLIVIGAGAAGLVTSYIAAALKARVTLVERHQMGGDCLNYGCVPSKALIKSAKLAHQLRHRAQYGLAEDSAEVGQVDFAAVMARVNRVIGEVAPHDSIERYESLGVEVLQGHAQLLDPWRVQITDAEGAKQVLSARSIVLASGASPRVPDIPGLAAVGFWSSETLWHNLSQANQLPQTVLVLGGGPIGCELSQALARLGAKVVQVERGPRLLAREDAEVSELVAKALRADGVELCLEQQVLRFERREGQDGQEQQKWAQLSGQGEHRALMFDELIIALGRTPRLSGYGLEELGLLDEEGGLVSDSFLASLMPNIYAAGDLVGPYQFTHVAAHQAWYACVNALFGGIKRFAVDYRVIPATTFVDPEVARVGLNEREAKAQGIAYEVTRFDLEELDRAIADGATEGFVKVLTRPGSDQILGACIVGERAGDLLAEFVLAMRWKLGLNKILGTIHSYPTWAEANKYAAGSWKRAHAPQWALRWLRRYFTWQRG
ncbi:MAG TPA: FAD-dependent oxidoreductase, partial [Cellvibrionaceae bacterium]|nr:FAD-dependent oxidoreductase [Cellvibrionaceae bacterium]